MKLPILPPMQCDKGCGQCCTVVMCKDGEYAAVERYAQEHGIEPKDNGVQCPWYQDGQCQIYPVRPFVCALYGHVERMTCPFGYNVNIPARRERELVQAYGRPTRCLHEILGDDWLTRLHAALAEMFPCDKLPGGTSQAMSIMTMGTCTREM